MWTQTTLGETCKMYQPKTISTKMLLENGSYPVFGANGKIGKYDKYNHEKPQLIIGCRGSCGSVNISEPFSWINGNAMVIQPPLEKISLRYMEYLFRGGIDLSKAINGSSQPQITRESLKKIKFSYPNISEQLKIVKKIDQLFLEIDKGFESLKKAKSKLRLFRQSLIEKALEGKLTTKWRSLNKQIESSKKILQLKENLEADKKILNKSLSTSHKNLEFMNQKTNGWKYSKLGELIEISQNGLSKRNSKSGIETIVIRLLDIVRGEIDYSNPRLIKLTEKEREKYLLKKDDLLCIRVNGSPDLVGRFILVGSNKVVAYCDHFIRYRINKDLINPNFLKYFLSSKYTRDYIELNKVSSAGQNTVSQSTINNMEIFYGTIQEQQQIVSILEEKLSLVDSQLKLISEQLENAEILRKSILKKAFSGALFIQDKIFENMENKESFYTSN